MKFLMSLTIIIKRINLLYKTVHIAAINLYDKTVENFLTVVLSDHIYKFLETDFDLLRFNILRVRNDIGVRMLLEKQRQICK